MKRLDVNHINIFSSYHVWEDSNRFYFETDYGLKYFVDFSLEDNPRYVAYWFNLVNMSGASSPKDVKIWQTVFCVIDEFFRKNPDIMLYICSTAGEQQAQRARLFSYWFNKAGQQERYYFKTAEIKGDNPLKKDFKEYVAIIVPRNHPQAEEVLAFFDEETTMFNTMKP
jgi:hypothetical protein